MHENLEFGDLSNIAPDFIYSTDLLMSITHTRTMHMHQSDNVPIGMFQNYPKNFEIFLNEYCLCTAIQYQNKICITKIIEISPTSRK